MYCSNCGKEVDENAAVCMECGATPSGGQNYCQNCGAESGPNAVVCTQCGVQLQGAAGAPQGPAPQGGQGMGGYQQGMSDKSKMAAGLLGIFLGGFGVHRFYLGYTGIGIAQIAVTVVTCGFGAIWGLIEGILILTGSMNTDADGLQLRD